MVKNSKKLKKVKKTKVVFPLCNDINFRSYSKTKDEVGV